jgi:hypothetical protein
MTAERSCSLASRWRAHFLRMALARPMRSAFESWLRMLYSTEKYDNTDSAEEPPIFRKRRGPRESRAKTFFLKLIMSDFYELAAALWWCFQLLVFAQKGFFSRIRAMG